MVARSRDSGCGTQDFYSQSTDSIWHPKACPGMSWLPLKIVYPTIYSTINTFTFVQNVMWLWTFKTCSRSRFRPTSKQLRESRGLGGFNVQYLFGGFKAVFWKLQLQDIFRFSEDDFSKKWVKQVFYSSKVLFKNSSNDPGWAPSPLRRWTPSKRRISTPPTPWNSANRHEVLMSQVDHMMKFAKCVCLELLRFQNFGPKGLLIKTEVFVNAEIMFLCAMYHVVG